MITLEGTESVIEFINKRNACWNIDIPCSLLGASLLRRGFYGPTKVSAERDPAKVPFQGVDVAMESTGATVIALAPVRTARGIPFRNSALRPRQHCPGPRHRRRYASEKEVAEKSLT